MPSNLNAKNNNVLLKKLSSILLHIQANMHGYLFENKLRFEMSGFQIFKSFRTMWEVLFLFAAVILAIVLTLPEVNPLRKGSKGSFIF